MARIRTIKPEFFTSEDIVELSPLARLLYIALWCEADKEGRLVWKPNTFKMRYLPADECDIHALCDALVTRGLVVLYGDGFAFIPSFKDHQHINPRESSSKLPEPELNNPRVSDASILDLHAQGGREGKGKERNTRHSFDASAMELPPVVNKNSWAEWIDYRKAKRKPVSEKAADEQIKFLSAYDQPTQAQIISASILNDWQGLFAPKPQPTQNHEPQSRRLKPL